MQWQGEPQRPYEGSKKNLNWGLRNPHSKPEFEHQRPLLAQSKSKLVANERNTCFVHKTNPSFKNGMRSSFLCFFFPFGYQMDTKMASKHQNGLRNSHLAFRSPIATPCEIPLGLLKCFYFFYGLQKCVSFFLWLKNGLQAMKWFAKTLCEAKESFKNAKRASQPCF